MTREEIVKALRCFASEDNCPFDECNEKCPYWMEIDKYDIDNPNAEISDVHQLCRAAADLLEQDAKKTGWISVKDRLPKDGTPVIVLCRHASHPGVWYWATEFTTQKSHMWHDGTARYWFPLPKPPKEEKA